MHPQLQETLRLGSCATPGDPVIGYSLCFAEICSWPQQTMNLIDLRYLTNRVSERYMKLVVYYSSIYQKHNIILGNLAF